MRRSFRGRKKQQQSKSHKEFRANEKILAQQVMLIDDQGESLGVVNVRQALALARERDLDLVEVSPKSQPPICKIMDYGSFKYQRDKQERKQKAKQKTTETKTVKLSARISQHDQEFRGKQALKFLQEGHKVKIEMQLRGRENQHADLAEEQIIRFISEINNLIEDKELKTEQTVKKQGNKLSAVISL